VKGYFSLLYIFDGCPLSVLRWPDSRLVNCVPELPAFWGIM